MAREYHIISISAKGHCGLIGTYHWVSSEGRTRKRLRKLRGKRKTRTI